MGRLRRIGQDLLGLATIGDAPDRTRVTGGDDPVSTQSRLRVGSGLLLMVGPTRACHDGGTMSAQSATSAAPAGPEFRRAYRDTTSPMIGGVAAGVARHLALDPLWAAAGSPLHAFHTTAAELVRMTGGRVCDVKA